MAEIYFSDLNPIADVTVFTNKKELSGEPENPLFAQLYFLAFQQVRGYADVADA
ncbi:hypothetical protein [Kosakonia cowanii]|jgi:hypothetical protein|uniref:hypothetical protein n=1 Tax=Kosakonia cowanii TaxID=208223 RepID=UPI000ABD5711|nr:hypothetical protein [Kosakonia cowanii]